MSTIFSPKTSEEVIRITFDFSNVILDSTESISSVSWHCNPSIGIDVLSESMLNVPITLNPRSTSRLVSGGIQGNTYSISCAATTTQGQVFASSGTIKIS